MAKVCILIIAFVLMTQCGAYASPTEVGQQIQQVLRNSGLASTKTGILFETLGTQKKIFSYNASTPLVPASNLKLLTTGCALMSLGLDFRFVTTVLGKGIDRGILPGNLILHGSGDPTWSKDFFPKATTPLLILAQKLKEKGLRVIEGDLIVDDSVFDRQFTGHGWKSRYQWEEYASEVSALSLNKNEVKVFVVPGNHLRSPVQVALWPKNHALKIVNHAWTSSGGSSVSIQKDRLNNEVVISGPLNLYHGAISFTFNVHNPPLFVGSVFEEILKQEGIRLRGRVRTIKAGEYSRNFPLQSLADVQSPPLIQIVHHLNKESDNFLAEHVFRALGAFKEGKGTLQKSTLVVDGCLNDLGLSSSKVVLADGSGLSDENLVAPSTLVGLLQGMAQRPIGAEFKETLPRGGIDGTLDERLSDVVIEAKTGAIRGVNSLSGYLLTNSGQSVVFSIMLNRFSFSSEEARSVIDRIVRIVAKT